MGKEAFLAALRDALRGLPPKDLERSLDFYREMLDDRMEDGLSEEAAVAAMGPVEEIVAQILSETPLPKLVREKVRPRRALRAWEIVLLVLGSPVWLPLLAALAAVVLALYAAVWAVIVSLYAVDLSFAACGVAGLFGIYLAERTGNLAAGIMTLGAGLLCAGIAIFLFFGFNQATRGILLGSKRVVLGLKSRFVGKEAAK